jgi:hypothetical protein
VLGHELGGTVIETGPACDITVVTVLVRHPHQAAAAATVGADGDQTRRRRGTVDLVSSPSSGTGMLIATRSARSAPPPLR